MAPRAIVSYDGSPADRDALALAGRLRAVGADLTLAYVRHACETRADRELLADVEASGRLLEGATRLGDPDLERRVVMSPSTADGLAALAGAIGAELIVFGPECRTPRGRVGLQRSAARLLENGPTALGLAPAGHDDVEMGTIGILRGTADEAAIETAFSLAQACGATVRDAGAGAGVDLLVVGSRREAAAGRVVVSAAAAATIDDARCPVIITAREAPLQFGSLVAV